MYFMLADNVQKNVEKVRGGRLRPFKGKGSNKMSRASKGEAVQGMHGTQPEAAERENQIFTGVNINSHEVGSFMPDR